MYASRNFNFFESKTKKTNKKPAKNINHSRSLSAKSDFTKNSARVKVQSNPNPLTKKQKQIRQAIQYRYRKSKVRDYVYEQPHRRSNRKYQRSRSSQMEQYRNLKQIKYVNLKQYHERQQKRKNQKIKQQSQIRRSIKNRLKIRTDSSLIIKTQGSQKSMDRLKFLKPYMQQSNRTPNKNQDWKFISIQFKGNSYRSRNNKSQKNQVKIKSHRTLTLQQKSRSKMKGSGDHKSSYKCDFIPKFAELNKVHQKYKL